MPLTTEERGVILSGTTLSSVRGAVILAFQASAAMWAWGTLWEHAVKWTWKVGLVIGAGLVGLAWARGIGALLKPDVSDARLPWPIALTPTGLCLSALLLGYAWTMGYRYEVLGSVAALIVVALMMLARSTPVGKLPSWTGPRLSLVRSSTSDLDALDANRPTQALFLMSGALGLLIVAIHFALLVASWIVVELVLCLVEAPVRWALRRLSEERRSCRLCVAAVGAIVAVSLALLIGTGTVAVARAAGLLG